MRRILALLVLAATAVPAGGAAAQALRGSRESVDRMYRQARAQELTFYRSGKGVRGAAESGKLVRMSGNDDYRLANVAYPYALSSTRRFVQRLSSQYRDACGERLVVTSGVRPTSYRLFNAADRSVHPTGMAVDIRKPTRRSCLRWLRETLLHVEGQGAIEATEEFRPPHFHVAVFPRQYLAYIGEKPAARGSRTGRTANRGSGTTYRVRRGDSLWAIARRHGTSVERLKDANDIRSSRLVAGQLIVIPAGR
ncbi:MAG TPA: DUF5715 family protein [Longimicrobiaceae bacterium]|nr:DUF5715 family protein [Longimicrobiaceae bacterium]